MNVLCCSGGNDSVALIQWAKNAGLTDCYVLYNDTGWAAPFWPVRMAEIRDLCTRYGYRYHETKSIGFERMVVQKSGFPMAASRMQFCSNFLKKQPTLLWLNEIDPCRKALVYIGIRREESQNRKNHPTEIIGDDKYGGRLQRFPLVELTERERDFLIDDTGLDTLLHSSMECFPCVNANRSDIRLLSRYPEKVSVIAELERYMGYTGKGKPKVMFRPYRHMGAVGIENVVKWALCEKGRYGKSKS